ncbi:interleukin-12 subunit beta-like [Sinocyclocheilus rhinocerous]|uniref:interleukin-12 subunit beta-like n=1 Tax=Sinocyclocheilus rhinocerous TaxID=307959 RepID=UPI0007BA1401|nr:PREDICTED: interleukin-12 subunit beta-like [Sinocyclocheilus rhinocerous]
MHNYMMFFLLLSTLLFLQSSADGSIKTEESYWTLKPNVLVVNVNVGEDVNVPLICGEAYEGENITWTMITKQGYIDCSTNNYGGSFKCNWTWDVNRNGHVAHIKATRPGGSNISCSLDSSGNITCLDHDYCPYAEEVERINLTIYFRSSFVVESYNTRFYIMDIVRPDMVPISRINKTSVEVKYPHSWSTPSSYFPLMFQVKEIRCRKHDNCDCSKPNSQEIFFTQSHKLPVTKGMTVCVRARDEFCNSSWSDWNQYKCKTRTNSKQRKREPKLKML